MTQSNMRKRWRVTVAIVPPDDADLGIEPAFATEFYHAASGAAPSSDEIADMMATAAGQAYAVFTPQLERPKR